MSNNMNNNTPGTENKSNLSSAYSENLVKYRNLLTTKIFEKSEQIKNEFTAFCKLNSLSVIVVPDSLEAFDRENLKLRLTFLTPQPERAQVFLTIFFTSPKEFYLNIYHKKEILKTIPPEEVTSGDLKEVEKLYKELESSDVYLSYYDKNRITESEDETAYSNFTDIIEQLYSAPKKF